MVSGRWRLRFDYFFGQHGSVLLAFLIGVIAAFSVISFNYLISPLQDRIHNQIKSDFQSGEYLRQIQLPASSRQFPLYTDNGCLLAAMSLIAPESIGAGSISPKRPLDGTPTEATSAQVPLGICQHFGAVIDWNDGAGPMPSLEYYHRYIHGQLTLFKFVNAVTSLAIGNYFYLALCLAPLLITTLIAFARTQRAPQARDKAFGIVAVSLALFFGTLFFGRSPGFAPSDAVLYWFLLAAYFWPALFRGRSACWSFSLFGAMTGIFEFLTGGLPMGISLILFSFAWPANDEQPQPSEAIAAISCFISAAHGTFAGKMGLVIWFWSWNEVLVFWNALNVRVSSGLEGQIDSNEIQAMAKIGLDPFGPSWNRGVALFYAAAKIVQNAHFIGLGSRPIGAGLLVLGGMAWLLIPIMVRNFFTQLNAKLLFTSGLVIPVWFIAFTNHTIVHAGFMGRLAIWPGITACALYFSGELELRFKTSKIINT